VQGGDLVIEIITALVEATQGVAQALLQQELVDFLLSGSLCSTASEFEIIQQLAPIAVGTGQQ
jgi:hypothetical protein